MNLKIAGQYHNCYFVSKIFEKIARCQTPDYLDKHKILYKYQSGFHTKHSTDTLWTLLNNEMLNGIDKGLLTGMIFIDQQKAFDTIDHEFFFDETRITGFDNSAILYGIDHIWKIEHFK